MLEGLDKATQKQRMKEAVDFHAQQEDLNAAGQEAETVEGASAPTAATTPEAEKPPAPTDAPKLPEKLRYASMDKGLVFLKPDGTEHHPSSAQEETELQMAAAAHMAMGQQTPGMPELEMQMLDANGKLPEITPEPTPTPGAEPARDPNAFDIAQAESDGSGGLRNHSYKYRLPDGTFEKNSDGSDKLYTQQEVDRMRSAAPAAGREGEPSPEELARRLAERNARNGRAQGPTAGVPERDGYLDPHKIFAPQGAERSSHFRSGDWRIDDKEYIGVKVKRIQDILANEREQNDFGLILKAINPEKGDVLLRYKQGTATPDDTDFMTLGAHEYSKWSQKAEEINKELKSEDVELFARRNSDMRNLNTHLKAGGELEYVKRLVMYKAMTDRAGMQDIDYAFKDLRRARGTARFKRSERNRVELAKRVGIDPNDYGPMFDLKNPEHRAETELRLANHIHEQAGGFRRALDWAEKFTGMSRTGVLAIPGSSRNKAILAVMEANRITPNQKYLTSPTSWVLDTVDQSLHTIASHLGELAGNEAVRSAVQRETVTNQKSSFESEQGPRSFAQVQSLEKQERFSGATIKQRYETFMNTDEYRNAPTPEVGEQRFRQKELREARGEGWFAWLWRMIVGQRVENVIKEKRGAPATR